MKITVQRHQIREAVAGIGKVISGRQALPVLACVRLRARGGEAVAEATDLDQWVTYRFETAGIEGEGACILPLATLRELSRGGETVEFDAADPLRVSVTSHVGVHAMQKAFQGLEPGEWPDPPADVSMSPATGFLEAYRRLAPFASTDATRAVINSILVEVGKGEPPVTMVATDGRRMVCVEGLSLPLPQSIVVPVTKFLGWNGLGTEAEIGLRTDAGRGWLGVRAGRFLYAVKTVEGTYPAFRQVIPATPGEQVITLADGDVALLRQVLPTFPGDEAVTLVGRDGQVTLYGREAGDGRWSTLRLEGGSYRGQQRLFIGLNRHFLLDALVAGFREFAATDALSPVLSRDGRGGTHVLMPLRVCDPEAAEKPGTEAPKPEENAEEAAAGVSPADPATSNATQRRHTTMTNGSKTAEPAALDAALAALDVAKSRLREVATALSDVADAVKAAVREGRAQDSEVRKAKEIIGKLQSITLKAA